MEIETKESALIYWLNISFSQFEINPLTDLKPLSNPEVLLSILNQM
jgi:hypothetical protein